jgi:hypothetical protein
VKPRAQNRRIVDAAYRLGGASAAQDAVDLLRRPVRCPACDGKAFRSIGEGGLNFWCAACQVVSATDRRRMPPGALLSRGMLYPRREATPNPPMRGGVPRPKRKTADSRCPACRRPLRSTKGHLGKTMCRTDALAVSLLDAGLVPYPMPNHSIPPDLVKLLGGRVEPTSWPVSLQYTFAYLDALGGTHWRPKRFPSSQLWLPLWVRILTEVWRGGLAERDACLEALHARPDLQAQLETTWRLGGSTNAYVNVLKALQENIYEALPDGT